MSKGVVLLLVFAAGLVILVLLIVALASARQKAATAGNLPPSRRPGPTDEALEGRLMENDHATGGTVKRFTPPGAKTPVDFQAPNLHEVYRDDPNVSQLAWNTIQQGRPGTPMPTWGVRYGGAMNDQQITNLVNYILSIQSDGKKRPQLDFQSLSNREAVALVRALRAG